MPSSIPLTRAVVLELIVAKLAAWSPIGGHERCVFCRGMNRHTLACVWRQARSTASCGGGLDAHEAGAVEKLRRKIEELKRYSEHGDGLFGAPMGELVFRSDVLGCFDAQRQGANPSDAGPFRREVPHVN